MCKAHIDAECARCLEPLDPGLRFTREYFVRDRDLEDPDFELPCNENGCLDLEELAYQELILRCPQCCCAVLIVKVYAPSAARRRRQGVPANRQTMLPLQMQGLAY